METQKIVTDVETAIRELIDKAEVEAKDILILGGSTSEIQGKRIGSATDLKLGEKIINKIREITKEYDLFLAVQGCEHTNRVLVIERECQDMYKFPEVNVIPHRSAGGAFAAAAFHQFEEAVTVESIEADLGIDIGDALIGMHLKNVAVPVRLSLSEIGEAHVTAARTRLKMVGGVRARYRDL